MLIITVAQVQPVVILAVSGSVDSLTADTLTSALGEHLKAGRSRMVADFADVNYTSSAGLRSLLIALKEARRAGGDIRLAAVQPSVHKVLSLAGFTSIIQIFATRDAACASFGGA